MLNRSTLARLVVPDAASVMALAAAGKLIDYETFIGSLDTFSLVRPRTRMFAAILVPPVECVPMALLLARRDALANIWTLGLLGFLSAILAWHWVHRAPPTCACLGLWADYLQLGQSARDALIRNAVIATVAVAGLIISLRRRPPDTRSA